MAGTVRQTRYEAVRQQLLTLQPDFNLDGDGIPLNSENITDLPNPLHEMDGLFQTTVERTHSHIHGNLHLESILNPVAGRRGPVAFDFATLEISLINRCFGPQIGEQWDDVRYGAQYLLRMYNNDSLHPGKPDLITALEPIQIVHETAHEHLYSENSNEELMIAVALVALWASMHDSYTLTTRRLAYMTSAIAIHQIRSS
jgi:hypothetical protein